MIIYDSDYYSETVVLKKWEGLAAMIYILKIVYDLLLWKLCGNSQEITKNSITLQAFYFQTSWNDQQEIIDR